MNINVFTDTQLYTWLHPDMLNTPTTLTITDTTLEEVESSTKPYKKVMLALSFKETEYKMLISRAVNRTALVSRLGGHTGEWIGHKVTVVADTATVGGRVVRTITITGVD